MGTQSISLFRRKSFLIFTGKYVPLAFSQEIDSISFDHGGESDSPKQEAGRAAFQLRLLYVYPLEFQA